MPDDFKPRKLFTIEEANAALPLVRAIAEDLSRLALELIDRRQRLQLLRSGRKNGARDLYSDELAEMESELERDSQQLHVYCEELQELGVELKNAPEGLVDFPTIRDGRVVYLCWKLGEPRVGHWHEIEAGFAGRQALEDAAADPASKGAAI